MLFRKFFIILFLVLFLTGCSFSDKDTADQPENICVTQAEKIIQGDSMAPMLANGESIILLENYYNCGYPVERGDVVAYNYGGNENPLIKVVKATSADKVEIFGGRLKINDEIMENSAGQEYNFTEKEREIMSLYIKNWHIPQDSFLIFGDNIGDSADSRKFGAVSIVDFLGEFVVK
ncbi:MAG: signal peptidase I [Patescibacteria group bacterium]